jgi:hypothetical protein
MSKLPINASGGLDLSLKCSVSAGAIDLDEIARPEILHAGGIERNRVSMDLDSQSRVCEFL